MNDESIAREELDDVNYQIREVYAHYGLTSYMSQVMERGLVNVLTLHRTATSAEPTQATYDTHLAAFSRLTMGQLVGQFEASNLSEPVLSDELREAARERNFIAHRFFWDRAAHFTTFTGRESMLVELADALSRFERVQQLLGDLVRSEMVKAGFGTDWVEGRLAETMADLRKSAPPD